MIEASLLGKAAVDEVFGFYESHARNDVLYPKSPQWMKDHVGKDFFPMGIRVGGELVAVAWGAHFNDFVYFIVENESLVIKNDGPYGYSGGWCIRPDQRSRSLFQLLTATVNRCWFTEVHNNEPVTLWGRMVGEKDADGNPLFWNNVGESITGLSYEGLRELPFGAMDRAIYERWPKEPLALKSFPDDVCRRALGKTHPPLVGPLNQFLRWGWVVLTERYVLTSLNIYFWSVKGNIPDAQEFFDQALHRTLAEFGSA